MGKPKLLLPLPDRPIVRRCVESITAASPAETIVVAPPDGGGIEEALAGLPVRVVRNELQDGEMADSVRTGLKAIAPSSTGVLICPADHPLVLPATISDLIEEHASSPALILVLICFGKRGHPTLFPRAMLEEVAAGATLRDVLTKHDAEMQYLVVDDDGVLLDIDTPEDYERLLALRR